MLLRVMREYGTHHMRAVPCFNYSSGLNAVHVLGEWGHPNGVIGEELQ